MFQLETTCSLAECFVLHFYEVGITDETWCSQPYKSLENLRTFLFVRVTHYNPNPEVLLADRFNDL